MKRLRGPDADLEAEMKEIRSMNKEQDGRKVEWKDLFKIDILKPTLMVLLLMLAANFTGGDIFLV